MRFKGKMSYSHKLMQKTLLKSLSLYLNECRSIHGLSAWNEELSQSTKHAIEKHWTQRISSTERDDSKEKFYVLSMFPYPSGQLHMGHVRVYTISDVMARFYRMNGKNVVHPMGWDAFGLPAENAARDHCIEPADWTNTNIQRMKTQLMRLGCSFDWECEVATCDPSYYRWTQSIFLKLHSKGLIYQKKALVNWDPVDETVLADEQVDEKGCSWRSGAVVEKKWLKQWFVRTTKFAKLLFDGLNNPGLEEWRDIINLQRHWIGSCHGSSFEFELLNENGDVQQDTLLSVWTENPELLYGVGFIAISPENSLNLLLNANDTDEVSENTVSGIKWKRLPFFALHPITKENLPIVVIHPSREKDSEGHIKTISYFKEGMDCRLGFPGENDLDYKIALAGGFPLKPKMVDEENRKMLPSAGPLAGLHLDEARSLVLEKARQINIGGYNVSPRLRDWLISRQRYWGTPIPMVHCKKCGAVPVEEKDLPVILPPTEINKQESSHKVLTLDKIESWKKTSCPRCGGEAERETDTMDTFVDSSWYYLRYLDSKNEGAPFSAEQAKKFMPVDLYIGGKEHAVLHLYYARFMSYFFHSEGLLPQPEPFKRLLVQGMVMGKTFKSKTSGKYLRPEEVNVVGKKASEKATGKPVSVSWEKMSKSKYNGVEPSDMFDEYGVDTTRLLVLADVAPTSHRNWSPETFPGIINWQRRLWLTICNFRDLRNKDTVLPRKNNFEEEEAKLWDARNYYLKGASFNYRVSYQLSIAISKMQGLTNSLRKASPAVIQQGKEFERALATQLVLLAPVAPHFASELWSGFVSASGRVNCSLDEIDWEKDVLEQKWPEVDDNYPLDLVCKLNGSARCSFKMPRKELDALNYETALEMCLSHPSNAKLSRMPYESATGDEKKRCIVDTTYVVYPGYQASLHFFTEAGVNKTGDKNEKGKEEVIEKDVISLKV